VYNVLLSCAFFASVMSEHHDKIKGGPNQWRDQSHPTVRKIHLSLAQPLSRVTISVGKIHLSLAQPLSRVTTRSYGLGFLSPNR